MMPRMLKRLLFVGILGLSCAVSLRARAEVEKFTTAVAATNGTVFGACNQITAHVAGSGSVAIGSGQAKLTSPAGTDAAALSSTGTLPGTSFVTSVKYSSFNYVFQTGSTETFALLAGLTLAKPQASGLAYYKGKAVIEIATYSDADGTSIYVQYWDASGTGHSYDGAAWVQGFKSAGPFSPGGAYTVSITRNGTQFSISVTGTVNAINASIDAASLLSGGNDVYFLAGDSVAESAYGNCTLTELELPCSGSVKTDGGLPSDSAVKPKDSEVGPPPKDYGIWYDISSTPPPPPPTRPKDDCGGCAVDSAGMATRGTFLILLFAVFQLGRRSRRRSRRSRWR
jgi:hypothetical protein